MSDIDGRSVGGSAAGVGVGVEATAESSSPSASADQADKLDLLARGAELMAEQICSTVPGMILRLHGLIDSAVSLQKLASSISGSVPFSSPLSRFSALAGHSADCQAAESNAGGELALAVCRSVLEIADAMGSSPQFSETQEFRDAIGVILRDARLAVGGESSAFTPKSIESGGEAA